MAINPFERELAYRWLEWKDSATYDRAGEALISVKRLIWHRGDQKSIAMVGEGIDSWADDSLRRIFSKDPSFGGPILSPGPLEKKVDHFLRFISANSRSDEIHAVYTRAYVYADEISPEVIQRVATHVDPLYVSPDDLLAGVKSEVRPIASNALRKGQSELVQLREILAGKGAKLLTLGALCAFVGIGAYSCLEKTHFIEGFETDLSNTFRSPELMMNAVVGMFEPPWMMIAKWALA